MANQPKTILIGPQHTVVQNTVYALPPRACLVSVSSTTGWETSVVSHTTGFTSVNSTEQQAYKFNTAAGWIRNTTGNATLIAKAL